MADQHRSPTAVASGVSLLHSTRLPTPTTTTPTTTTTNNPDPGSSAFYSLYDNSVDSSQTDDSNMMMSSPLAASIAVLSEFRYPSPPLPLPSSTDTNETGHCIQITAAALHNNNEQVSHHHHNRKRQKYCQEKREEEEQGGEEEQYYYGTLMFDHEDGGGSHFNHIDDDDVYYRHRSLYLDTALYGSGAATTDTAAVENAAIHCFQQHQHHQEREENFNYHKHHHHQVLESITELTPVTIAIATGTVGTIGTVGVGTLTGGGGHLAAPSSVVIEHTSSSLPIGLRLDSSAMEQIIAKMSQP